MSLPRSSRDPTHGNPTHQTMSPRLPRKTRHASYSSTGKLDTTLSLQVDQYAAAAASSEGRISPIHVASPNSSYSGTRPRRERTVDRYGSLDFRHSQEQKSRDKFGSLDRSAAMNRYGYRDQRERSLERATDYSGRVQRNRSLDRDYPLLAVSNRTLTDDMDGDSEVDVRYQQSQSSMLILSLQTQLVDLNRDYTIAQRELEQNKSQLNSYIASVKTFWSPELKKERALRKEEVQKVQKLQELNNKFQHETQVLQVKFQNLEERLSLQGIKDGQSADGGALTALTRESDRQEKEIAILQNTISEIELRIDIQKKTLSARDASIKKLVEMLQTRNIPIETILDSEAEKDKLRNEIATLEKNLLSVRTAAQTHETQTAKLTQTVQQLKAELSEAQSNGNRANRESENLEEVQALLNMKNTRISGLESELKDLERQIAHIRNSTAEADENKKQMETLHSHETVLKSKLENMRLDMSSKTTEILSLQNKVDTLQNHRRDTEQHADILKQQLKTKDESLDLLKAELLEMQSLIKEKESVLVTRNSQLESIKTDKMKLESDFANSKYEVEVNIRKLTLAQKKLDNYDEQLKEKIEEVASLETQVASLTAKSNQHEAFEQLHKTLSEKNKLVERLKEQRDKAMDERQEEVNSLQKSNRDLSCELEKLKQIINDKQTELLDVKDTASQLRSEKLKIDSLLNQIEKSLSEEVHKNEDLVSKVKQLQDELNSQSSQKSEQQQKIEDISKQMTSQSEELVKYQREIDRLLDILKEMENEKHNKDKQIREIQEQLKEAKQKYVTLRRNHQHADKKRTEESQNNGTGEPSVEMNNELTKFKNRVEELEEALKQSVKITAKCEMIVSQQKQQIEKQDKQIKEMKDDVTKAEELSSYVKDMEESLREKHDQLRKFVSERSRHMEEAYEMKQEAILAAISEKDSHIALLEASKTKTAREDIDKLNSEKQRLNLRLKDLTTQRMLLVVEQSSDNSRMLASQTET